jgi:two-component system chemotaxis response regulator CheB
MDKIRTLIVDDSAFMRKSIQIMLESDPFIEIIDTARDGQQGYELAKKLKPDVITMDIEMPRMDGLTALKKIMQECPTAVIMVSSLTTEGAEATLKALDLGAVDFIPKELSYVNVNIIKKKEEIVKKVKEIGRQSRLKRRTSQLIHKRPRTASSVPQDRRFDIPKHVYRSIALGVSTGGPLSLQKIIPVLSEKINIPVFIVQHMPPHFTKSLADRLNSMSPLNVKEASNGDRVEGGTVYIAPGGKHMTLTGSNGSVSVNIGEQPDDTLHRPSVDVMMNSVLNVYGKSTLGVIMTGMGKDGFEAIKRLKSINGYSIAQNEETCVVYGMPRAVVEGNLADAILPLEEISKFINNLVVKNV